MMMIQYQKNVPIKTDKNNNFYKFKYSTFEEYFKKKDEDLVKIFTNLHKYKDNFITMENS